MRRRSVVSWVTVTMVAAASTGTVVPGAAVAQVNVQVQIAVPTVRFETTPVLVEVSPGVQVVEDYEQEVFFVDGWYWYRSGPAWYHTRNHRGGWVVVQDRAVPRTLVYIPRGKYKHYRRGRPHGHRDVAVQRGDGRYDQDRRGFKDHHKLKHHKDKHGRKHGGGKGHGKHGH